MPLDDTILAVTPQLEIEVTALGRADGPSVFLLHGWPDSARTWQGVAPVLADAGFRVLMPSLRGFGGTRFRRSEAMRSGQLASLGQDLVDLADAMGVERFSVVGHDWGARAAYIASCLWPERVVSCVALSVGWGTNAANQQLSLRQVQNYWYHWYLATEPGQDLLWQQPQAFTRHIWDEWCPFWQISDEEFALTAQAFSNPDWAAVVLHSYRHRWGWAPADPLYVELESRLSAQPLIHVPTLVLHGAQDPCNSVSTSEGKGHLFTGPYRRELVERCGHFPQREHPEEVSRRILAWLRKCSA